MIKHQYEYVEKDGYSEFPLFLQPEVKVLYRVKSKSGVFPSFYKTLKYVVVDVGTYAKEHGLYRPVKFYVREKVGERFEEFKIQERDVDKLLRRIYNKSKVLKANFSNVFALMDLELLYLGNTGKLFPIYAAEYLARATFKGIKPTEEGDREVELTLKFRLLISGYQLTKLLGLD